MSEPIPSDEQLARYLAGDISANERAMVDAWAASDASNRSELDRLRAVWQAGTAPSKWDVDRAWSRVDARLAAPAPLTVVQGSSRSFATRTLVTRLAAALLVAVGIGYLWRAQSTPQSAAVAEIRTGIGEQRDTLLADSTRIILGPASILRIASDYGARERTVELVGEAWFQVHHDAERPFSVRAGGTITQDIGTEFTVRALAGDTLVRVAVMEGVASLRRADLPVADAVELRANDVGVLTTNSSSVRAERNSASQNSWREGQLTFENALLSDVTNELRRWYSVTIVLSNPSLGTRRLSAPLPSRDLAEALDVLRLALRVEIEQRGDTVFVR